MFKMYYVVLTAYPKNNLLKWSKPTAILEDVSLYFTKTTTTVAASNSFPLWSLNSILCFITNHLDTFKFVYMLCFTPFINVYTFPSNHSGFGISKNKHVSTYCNIQLTYWDSCVKLVVFPQIWLVQTMTDAKCTMPTFISCIFTHCMALL